MDPSGHRRVAAMLATLPLALVLATADLAHAQDATADAFCALLTTEEVGGALGGSVAATSTFESCGWMSDDAGSEYVYMAAYWDSLTLDERIASADGVDLTVGGRRALFVPDLQVLYVELDQGVLALQVMGSVEGTDVQAALSGLGELAVQRAGTLPAPPTPPPPPSGPPESHADPALEALFPKTVGGQALTVQSMAGAALTQDEESRQQLDRILETQGKTVADLSYAYAAPDDFSSWIQAFRVAGADAAALLPQLLEMQAQTQEMTQAPGQVAGKAVNVVTSGGTTVYYYTQGDVVWIVSAQEPALTEIFTALP